MQLLKWQTKEAFFIQFVGEITDPNQNKTASWWNLWLTKLPQLSTKQYNPNVSLICRTLRTILAYAGI